MLLHLVIGGAKMNSWNNTDSLRQLSLFLTLATVILAVLAAAATGLRYFVDRRVSALSAQATQAKLVQAEQGQKAALSKLEELAHRVQTRHLTSAQIDTIAKAVRTNAHEFSRAIHVTAAISNHEAQTFGHQIVGAFQRGGIVAELSLPIPGLTSDVTGLHVGVKNQADPPKAAKLLSQIFREAGLESRITLTKPDFFQGEPFVIVVGAKVAAPSAN
jgi:hypothetical protein